MLQATEPISYYDIIEINIYIMEGSEKSASLNLCLKATLDVCLEWLFCVIIRLYSYVILSVKFKNTPTLVEFTVFFSFLVSKYCGQFHSVFLHLIISKKSF